MISMERILIDRIGKHETFWQKKKQITMLQRRDVQTNKNTHQ